MDVPIVGMVIVGVVAVVAIVYGRKLSFCARMRGNRCTIDIAKAHTQAETAGQEHS